MQIEKEALDCLSQQFPELYDTLSKIEAKGILVCVHVKIEKIANEDLVGKMKKSAETLLAHAEGKLEQVPMPILYFLLYEEDGVRMEVAYTTKKGEKEVLKADGTMQCGVLPMKFQGRKCICHWVNFGK